MAMEMENDDWQLKCGEMKQRAAHLLQSGQWSDCSFLVGAEPDQLHVKAHKLILAMASPVFEAMFYGPVAEGNEPIPIPDIQPETFQALIEYIYTDNIELQSSSNAVNLYYGAQKYMMPHLLTVCSTYLLCNLTPQAACRTYEFAQLFGEIELMSECVKMISANAQQVLTDSSFEEASIDTVVKIFSMDPLNVNNELELFTAAEKYAKGLISRNTEASNDNASCILKDENHSQETHLEEEAENGASASEPSTYNDNSEVGKTGTEENVLEKSKNVKESIWKALCQIRFLAVSAQNLAEYQTLTSLLTEKEILAIFMNIASSNTHMAMPDGFSTSREPRDRC